MRISIFEMSHMNGRISLLFSIFISDASPLCTSLFLCLPLLFIAFLSLPPSLPLSLSPYALHCFSPSLSPSLSLSLSFSLSLSLSLSLRPSVSVSLSLFLRLQMMALYLSAKEVSKKEYKSAIISRKDSHQIVLN